MAQQSRIQLLMAKLSDALDDPDLLHRTELEQISSILEANKDKITSQPPKLEKKDELPELLRKIDDALRQCQARSKQQQPAAKSKKKTMPSVSDCNPFKSRASPSSSAHPQVDDASPPLSVEDLLRQTRDIILGDAADHNAGAVMEFYEWTTSYVDESRIYGWSDMADKVVDALVGGEEGSDEVLFRAAGITGIHGSGKTALAQKVFVHDRIKDAFPLRLWVCVGPPDSEDRFDLLYRMLDNLGLDTAKLEDIVDKSEAVNKASADDKESSKIGVLLYILHVTLYKTGYLIVFDDIRAYDGSDGWYSNLTLEPPRDGEWNERLAYGLPKAKKSAVLVICRNEDHARAIVRTGSVFRPPELGTEDGWKLFKREYDAAKKKAKEKEKEQKEEAKGKEQKESKEEEQQKEEAIDERYKELEEVKDEIIGKCLGLPVAIIEAAKGFAVRKYEKDDTSEAEAKAAGVDQTATSKTEPAQAEAHQPAN